MSKTNGSSGKPGNLGFMNDAEIAAHLSMKYRVPTIELGTYEIDPAIIALVPRDLCERHVVIPVSRAGSSLIVAMVDPTNNVAVDELEACTSMNVEPVIATASAIRAAIARYYEARS